MSMNALLTVEIPATHDMLQAQPASFLEAHRLAKGGAWAKLVVECNPGNVQMIGLALITVLAARVRAPLKLSSTCRPS